MARILILSGKEDLAAKLQEDIERMEHNAAIAELNGINEAMQASIPDLVLVDLTFSGGIIEMWNSLWCNMEEGQIATIALVPEDRIREVELLSEMDDFIIYPYNVRELEMRMKLILSQQHTNLNNENNIEIGNLSIDAAKYEVAVDNEPIILTLKEYELLRYLITRRGRAITREVLLDQVWGYNYYGGTRTVDVHIARLRTKIETGEYSFIRTVRGVGYVFTDEYSAVCG